MTNLMLGDTGSRKAAWLISRCRRSRSSRARPQCYAARSPARLAPRGRSSPRADLVVRLLDASDLELSRTNIALAPLPYLDEHGGPRRPADVVPFAATVPFHAHARTVLLQDTAGIVLARATVSRSTPTVRAAMPRVDERAVSMSWGDDADGDRLTYEVSLVYPEGRVVPVASDSPATNFSAAGPPVSSSIVPPPTTACASQ
jgi:hypothetical protein